MKFMYKLPAKILAIILMICCSATMCLGGYWMLRVLQYNNFKECFSNTAFRDTSYYARSLAYDAYNNLVKLKYASQYQVNGTYDGSQTLDIMQEQEGITCDSKDKNTTYTLADLERFQESGGADKIGSIAQDLPEYYMQYVFSQYGSEYDEGNYYWKDKEGSIYYSDADLSQVEIDSDAVDAATDDTARKAAQNPISYLVFNRLITDTNGFPMGNEEVSGSELVSQGVELTQIKDIDTYQKEQILQLDQVDWKGKTAYTTNDYSMQFCILYQQLKGLETVLPQSGISLSEYALYNPKTVSLVDLCTNLKTAVENVHAYGVSDTASTMAPWVKVYYQNAATGQILTNGDSWAEMDPADIAKNIQTNDLYSLAAITFADNGYSESYIGNGKELLTKIYEADNEDDAIDFNKGTLIVAVDADALNAANTSDYTRSLISAEETYNATLVYFIPGFIMVLASLIIGIILLIGTIAYSGRRDESSTRYAGLYAKHMPIELMLIVDMIVWILFVAILVAVGDNVSDPFAISVWAVLLGGVCAAIVLGQLLPLICKCKAKAFLKNSIFAALAKCIQEIYKNRKVTGKAAIIFVLFVVLNLICAALVAGAGGFGVFCFLVLYAATFVAVMKECRQRQKIKEGISEIAGGNLDYRVDTKGMKNDNLAMASQLNNVREGMQTAIAQQMKSERMKTDLITNVSHDIKTPLTSIINYVDILKRSDIQDETIRGYITILDQKAQRLKNLTEDLVEASKISSGNITLEMQVINLKQLLKQTNGEFEEKFAKKNLELICNLPEADMKVLADGRRMWRVIENLYNNAAKYAMSSTRVYVDGAVQGDTIYFSIKNVSETALNISADELMERFVRGDVSRNTEGSGLGLEIARNLTVMQKGTFDIYLDGDLFKVTLTFPAVVQAENEAEHKQ